MKPIAALFRVAVFNVCFASLVGAVQSEAAQFEVERQDDSVTVKLDGKLVTRYLTKSGAKPVFWPVFGPTGDAVTRSYPIGAEIAGEKKDHIHQRSFWFTHGDVNGVDFWSENGPHGEIVHREFVEVSSGDEARIVTRNDWLGPDGAKICEDQRAYTIGILEGGAIYFDCDLRVTASAEKVVFGDTKEGAFGIRTAGSMDVNAKLGGRIVNSDGLTDTEAWGKRAAWVDYQGPVNGKTVGIAILNHPSSFRYPTYWHVRDYGLFAANPFGVRDFTGDSTADGAHAMAKNESFTLRYRVILHAGDEKAAAIAQAFEEYAATEPTALP